VQRRVELGGDWLLRRDFAVRSAGFPIDGLEVFGAGDEPARLRAVSRDPTFREAVAWQNRAALANAVDKIATTSHSRPSDRRRREQIVASYWQRYCAKNDTIGFFGPLAWGTIEPDGGPPLSMRSGGALVRARDVHFEAWPIQALAQSLGGGLRVPLGPWPERDLRAALEAHQDADLRGRGLAALDRFEAARAVVAAASRDELPTALAKLDEVFAELTGRDPVRNHGRAYGARTLAYVDCMRDLDMTIGTSLVDELAPCLRMIFEAARWYAGRVNAIGRQVIADAMPATGSGPFGPLIGRILGPMMALPPPLQTATAELQQRVDALLQDTDPATLAERAAAAFADHEPAWRLGVYQSADIQIAAASVDAIAAGDYLAVIADVHPGDNPLGQGLFAHRHPDPEAYERDFTADVGEAWPLLLPPWGPGMGVDARGAGRVPADTIYVGIDDDSLAPAGRRTWRPGELLVDGHDLVDRAGELRVPLADVFGLPTFVMAVRTFEPFADADHVARLQIGRVVLRRETWNVPAGEIPRGAEELGPWARRLGMPRRVFMKTPVERKPFLLDLDSPVLCRMAARHIRQAAAEPQTARVRFNEMLPGPQECWLTDAGGSRYTSELRLVAVDRRALPGAAPRSAQ
jgi:hypothetical protein